jgi:hypothetical protein
MLTIILACLFAVPAVQAADEDDHAAHHPDADQSQADPAMVDKATGMRMQEMQDRMKNMQKLMSKMRSTNDPQEREKLMQEHMTAMLEGMKSMDGMMSEGGMMGEGDMMGEGGMMGKDGMMMMHKKMLMRMKLMQEMMEQIIEREAIEQQMEGR